MTQVQGTRHAASPAQDEAGLVERVRAGDATAFEILMRRYNRRLYRADPGRLAELRTFLDDFWDDHLARLKGAAESSERLDEAAG